MRKHLAVLILAVFALVAAVGPAAARGPKEWPGYKVTSDSSTITGVVMNTADGLAIKATDGKEYLVHGQDLSAMVGKKVTVTGKISQPLPKNVVTVESVKEAK